MYYDVLYVFVYYLGIHKHIGEPVCIILIPIGLDLVLKIFCFNNVFFLFCNNELIFKLICSTSLLFKLSLNMNIHFPTLIGILRTTLTLTLIWSLYLYLVTWLFP